MSFVHGRDDVPIDQIDPVKQMDEQTRRENIDAGFDICGRCEGTGNELYSMFRGCTACGGTGRLKQPASPQQGE